MCVWICIWSIVNVSSLYGSKMGAPDLNIKTTHDTDIEWKRRTNSRNQGTFNYIQASPSCF